MGNLFGFSGRVGRKPFWIIGFVNIGLIALYFAWLSSLSTWNQPQIYTDYSGQPHIYWGTGSTQTIQVLFILAWIVLGLIQLSIGVRRWHDLDKSGWWVFISLVPFGSFYALYKQGFVRGDDGPNQYGAAPGSPGRLPVHPALTR